MKFTRVLPLRVSPFPPDFDEMFAGASGWSQEKLVDHYELIIRSCHQKKYCITTIIDKKDYNWMRRNASTDNNTHPNWLVQVQ